MKHQLASKRRLISEGRHDGDAVGIPGEKERLR